jgi:hypothetical protein
LEGSFNKTSIQNLPPAGVKQITLCGTAGTQNILIPYWDEGVVDETAAITILANSAGTDFPGGSTFDAVTDN